jgi:hypothetical protein
MRTRSDRRARLLTVVGLLGILAATGTPVDGRGSDGPPWCMSCPLFSERAGVDIVLNVLLYAPIGAGLALRRHAPRHIALIAFAMAAVIETLQVSVIPGRFASISDVIANTGGALLGAAAARHRGALLAPPPSLSRVLAVVAGALALAILHFTMWAQREVPEPAALLTLWRPSPAQDRGDSAHADTTTSRITYVTFEGRRHLGQIRLPSNDLAQRADRSGYQLEMGFIPAAKQGDEDPAFELRDPRGRRLLRVRQDGRHVAADLATRARVLRLRTPTARLRRFLSPHSERVERGALDTVHIRVRVAQGSLWMRARLGTKESEAAHRRGAFAGWSLLIPQSNSPLRVRILTFGWVVAMMLPPVYWAVLGMPPARARMSAAKLGARRRGIRFPSLVLVGFFALVFGLALEVLPRANGMDPAGLLEGTAAALALALGSHIALRTARRRANGRAAGAPNDSRSWDSVRPARREETPQP